MLLFLYSAWHGMVDGGETPSTVLELNKTAACQSHPLLHGDLHCYFSFRLILSYQPNKRTGKRGGGIHGI